MKQEITKKSQQEAQKKASQIAILGQVTKLTLGLFQQGTEHFTRHGFPPGRRERA